MAKEKVPDEQAAIIEMMKIEMKKSVSMNSRVPVADA